MNETTELFNVRREQLEKAVTDAVFDLFEHMRGAGAFMLDLPNGKDTDMVCVAGPVKDVKDMLRLYKPERWDLPTSDPMADVEAGMRLIREQPVLPEIIGPKTAAAMARALNDVVEQIDAGRFHDPATSCAHDDKEECDDCNDCGAVLDPNGEVKP